MEPAGGGGELALKLLPLPFLPLLLLPLLSRLLLLLEAAFQLGLRSVLRLQLVAERLLAASLSLVAAFFACSFSAS